MLLVVPSEPEVEPLVPVVEPLEAPWVVRLELVERRLELVLVLVVALVAAESAAG